MRVTWRDGVTTLAAAGAVVLEYAHYHNWSWSLVSSIRWTVTGIALAGLISFVFGYLLDPEHGYGWSAAAWSIAVYVAALTVFGLIFAASGYVMAMMLSVLAFWLASVVWHLAEPSTTLIHHHV